MTTAPPTRYARSGDARIAFQVSGDGPPDVALIGGPASHLDVMWDNPDEVRRRLRLASFARIVRFDRRGTGLSDPVDGAPTLDQQMDDLGAVLDAVGMERVALIGEFDVGLCAMYAATHPERVSALVLANVRRASAIAEDDGHRRTMLDTIEHHWGEGISAAVFAPTRATDPRFVEWWKRLERSAASPSMARKLIELSAQVDLRGVLPAIRVPTLVLHRRDCQVAPLAGGRDTAALIPGARFVEAPGTDIFGWPGADDPEMDIVEEFLTGRRPHRVPERVLATVLFTDIVESTGRAAELGDRAWRQLLDEHNALVRDRLARFRGREIKTIGDGFVATFDGPARAVCCAQAIVGDIRDLGLAVRCGLHTGECEMLDDNDVGGIAVHIAARVGGLACGGEVLVSNTVKDLVVGSELTFTDRGAQELRGVPGEWRLYALQNQSPRLAAADSHRLRRVRKD